MYLFGRNKPLASFLVAKCPACGSTAMVRVWTCTEVRYDGKRVEDASPCGHYVCDDCNAHLRVSGTGVTRVGPMHSVESSKPADETAAVGRTAPPLPRPIPVRFPQG